MQPENFSTYAAKLLDRFTAYRQTKSRLIFDAVKTRVNGDSGSIVEIHLLIQIFSKQRYFDQRDQIRIFRKHFALAYIPQSLSISGICLRILVV